MTVNLEKELLKQNKSVVNAKDLLVLKEYEKIGSIPDGKEVLHRLGMWQNMQEAENRLTYEKETNLQISKFNPDRVFHQSQIKKVCDKYYLRFLPSSLYNGTIDPQLPNKVTTFEIAYGISQYANYYVMAPASSFKLEPEPKDPLFFYKINDSYYYLVHKWGNDLNILRRILPILASKVFFWFTIILAATYVLYEFFSHYGYADSVKETALTKAIVSWVFGYVIEFIAAFVITAIFCVATGWDELNFRFIKKNKWTSQYL